MFSCRLIHVRYIVVFEVLLLCDSKIFLDRLSTIYLPYTYEPTPQYEYNANAVEQIAYDHMNKTLYAVGGTVMHIIDASDVTNMSIKGHHSFAEQMDATDVEVCGDYVLVTTDNRIEREEGTLSIFNRNNGGTPILVNTIRVGVMPDMLKPTKDCQRILVSIEAEPFQNNGVVTDPEGIVLIVKFSSQDLSGNYELKRLNFTEYNDPSRWQDLIERGARFVYRENGNTFSRDIEPEYITFNHDETKAYVSLQENNAIALIDMEKEEIADIYPLGYKNWNMLSFDASDKDSGISMKSWPVFGMYQPDGIKYISHNGIPYIITANEGDAKDHRFWSEEIRAGQLELSGGFAGNGWRGDDLTLPENLGRLKVTKENGRNETTSKYEALFAFGARSFSIWQADNMTQVYDSGDDIERSLSQTFPEVFNADADRESIASESFDERSDNKGPECESVEVGQIGRRLVIFVGNERPGSISLYSIGDDITKPQFESLWSNIGPLVGTWNDIYTRRNLSEIGPEDMRFLPATDSPSGRPMLIVSGSGSGTVSLFDVKAEGEFETWELWGQCSTSCGVGVRKRTRSCLQLEPEEGGYMCAGNTEETKQCSDSHPTCQSPIRHASISLLVVCGAAYLLKNTPDYWIGL